jgi:hypothetical protein
MSTKKNHAIAKQIELFKYNSPEARENRRKFNLLEIRRVLRRFRRLRRTRRRAKRRYKGMKYKFRIMCRKRKKIYI